MSDSPEKSRAQADKLAAGASGGFSWFGSKTDKLEQAAQLYTQAGNGYRLQKNGKEAGLCFEQAAGVYAKLGEDNDKAQAYIDASKAYRPTDPEDAARVQNLAIEHYLKTGNFRRAATYKEALVELYEGMGDNAGAKQAALDAAEWYEGDNAQALANKLFLKAADVSAVGGDYVKAIELYEKVAKVSVNNNLMKYSVKDYLMKAGICQLALNDQVGTQRALEKYVELDPAFQGQREYMLLNDLSEAVKSGDADLFSEKVYQFDQVNRLDGLKTKILLKVKDSIADAEEDFS